MRLRRIWMLQNQCGPTLFGPSLEDNAVDSQTGISRVIGFDESGLSSATF
jgi:hypothetical protein